MKFYKIILALSLLASGCSPESEKSAVIAASEQIEPKTVDEYCERYTSHLVDGYKKQSLNDFCMENYAGEFEYE